MLLSHCPVCKRKLEPLLADRTIYGLSSDSAKGLVAGLQAFTCGPKGHIIVIGAQGLVSEKNGPERHAVPPAQRTILNSWKEIATYLDRGVRTVQRWEREMGLPVHRPKGKQRSAVLAFTEEVDTWLHQTPVRLDGGSSSAEFAAAAPAAPPPGK